MCKCTPTRRTPFCGGPGCKHPITISIDPERLLICTENHGGHRAGYCLVCKENGWLDKIEHKPDCPLHPNYQSLRPPVLITGEWTALWNWHTDEKCRAANHDDFTEAQWHKERADAIYPYTTFGSSKPTPEAPKC